MLPSHYGNLRRLVQAMNTCPWKPRSHGGTGRPEPDYLQTACGHSARPSARLFRDLACHPDARQRWLANLHEATSSPTGPCMKMPGGAQVRMSRNALNSASERVAAIANHAQIRRSNAGVAGRYGNGTAAHIGGSTAAAARSAVTFCDRPGHLRAVPHGRQWADFDDRQQRGAASSALWICLACLVWSVLIIEW
jgi:hypothetical protein